MALTVGMIPFAAPRTGLSRYRLSLDRAVHLAMDPDSRRATVLSPEAALGGSKKPRLRSKKHAKKAYKKPNISIGALLSYT